MRGWETGWFAGREVRAAGGILCVLVASACGGSSRPPQTMSTEAFDPGQALEANRQGTLNPGDAIRVTVFEEEALSGEFAVDQNGTVVFPLLGERNVTGIAADSLERQLVTEYRGFLETPSINITVLRRVSILGEVRQPGLYPVDLTMSMNEAIALAGGISPAGNVRDIRLIRGDDVVVKDIEAGAPLTSTPMLSGDQIFVGERTWLSRSGGALAILVGLATAVTVGLIVR